MVAMTVAPPACGLHPMLSSVVRAPLPTLADLKALHPALVGQQLIDNPLMIIGLTIIGTSVGAVALRWVLHRAINRVVTGALTRAAAHASQTPRRTSRVLAQATGLDEA
jgi:hypothetical protein